MCARFGLSQVPWQLLLRLGKSVSSAAPFRPRWNVAPTDPVLAATNEGDRPAEMLRWGLIPSWADAPETFRLSTFNARIETIATARAFAEPLRLQRCVVFADGYYEWRRNADGSKTPMWIRRTDATPFALAGLWDVWHPHSGPELRSCTVITQPSAGSVLLEPIHSRMPVVLHEDAAVLWIAPGEQSPADALALLAPQNEARDWTAHPVSPRVGNVKNDDAALIDAVEAPLELF